MPDLMPCLKPPDWDAGNSVALPFPHAAGEPGLPVVALCRDGPMALTFVTSDGITDAGDAIESAMSNLESWEPDRVERIEVPTPDGEPLAFLVVGGLFAAEKALDLAYLRGLAAQLGTDRLFVAAPRRGLLMVSARPADEAHPHWRLFAASAAGQHRRAESPPISPVVYVYEDGGITGGYTLLDAPGPSRPAPPWWLLGVLLLVVASVAFGLMR